MSPPGILSAKTIGKPSAAPMPAIPRAFEKAAPRGVGFAPEEQAVGALRILAVEFVQAALGARRRFCGGFFHRMSPV